MLTRVILDDTQTYKEENRSLVNHVILEISCNPRIMES